MIKWFINKIKPYLKKCNLPYCVHEWEVMNKIDIIQGMEPIYKCKRCGEYRR